MQGEKDWQKYETARRLKKCVDRIRAQYREDWKSKEMRVRQRAVALYFIDKVKTRVSDLKVSIKCVYGALNPHKKCQTDSFLLTLVGASSLGSVKVNAFCSSVY